MEQKIATPKQKGADRSFSILLAEANIFLGQKIEELLSYDEAVLCVFHVTGKVQLLHEAATLFPDLILGDITLLKEKQTVETLQQITPLSRIVALTSSETEPYEKLSQQLSLDGLLEKGRIEIGELKQIVHSQSTGELPHE